MARSRILTLLLGLGLYSVQASLYQLPPFDIVHIGPLALLNDEATVLIVPSLDQTFSLNATQSGVAYIVSDGTLQLNQVSSLPNLLDDLLHVDDEDVQTGTIVVEMGGPLLGVLSDATNDVVVGDGFSAPGFTATLTSTGKLVVLGISTPSTTVWNTGGGTLYVQGDLGLVKVTAADEGGTYLGSSAHYPGSIASVDVHLSGSGSLIVATSSNTTKITGLSTNSGQVLYNQGTCTVSCITCEDVDRCKLARIRVPTLPQYWALSDTAAASEAASASPPPPPPPPPSPPPPMPIRDAKVWAQEITNLISPLVLVPAPAPSDPASPAGYNSASPSMKDTSPSMKDNSADMAPAPAPTAAPNVFPAYDVPDIASATAATPARHVFPATDVPDITSAVAVPIPDAAPAPAPAPAAAAAGAANSPAAAPDLAAAASGARFGSGGAAPDLAVANTGSPATAPRLAFAPIRDSTSAAAGPRIMATAASIRAGNFDVAGVDALTQEAAGK
ncbi:hypothetical protein COCOBI_11-0530 [Coccomyxa sp. Obi]|nr:hypothetical protein COCOBI_11-0530 [Coccomyxa sp. Obi]